MAVATTLMATLDPMIREELPTIAMESLPEIDPIYTKTIRTSQNVETDKIGRSWKVNHRFRTSVAGLVNPVSIHGGTPLTETNQTMVYSALQSFPDPAQTPHMGTIMRSFPLACHHGNFGIPTYLLKPQSLNSCAYSDIADDMKTVGEYLAHLEAVSFYLNGNSGYKYLGYIDTDDANLDWGMARDGTTEVHVTFTPQSSRIRWWKEGMSVDIYNNAAGTTLINMVSSARTQMIVDKVDQVAGTVTITSVAGVDIYNGGGLDGNYIGEADQYVFLQDSNSTAAGGGTVYKFGHYGVEDWILDSGTLFGGDATAWNRNENDPTAAFSLANYPQFKSFVTSNLAGPLTDTVFIEKIGQYVEAYGNKIDTLITTQKVINKYLAQASLGASRLNWDRTGKALNVQGGFNKIGFEWDGKSFDLLISPFCASGTLYGLKTKEGNLRRYVPPRSMSVGGISAPGSGGNFDLDGEFEFIMAMKGGGIFDMARAATTSRVIPMLEAPFQQFSQMAPIDVRGIKIAGITESN